MIIAITRCQLPKPKPKPITLPEARRILLGTAPTCQGVPGLLRKGPVGRTACLTGPRSRLSS